MSAKTTGRVIAALVFGVGSVSVLRYALGLTTLDATLASLIVLVFDLIADVIAAVVTAIHSARRVRP